MAAATHYAWFDTPIGACAIVWGEAGVRGAAGALRWNLGVFRADNRDDILFVADNAAGFGYFKNFGKTRRQGLEAGLPPAGAALRIGQAFSHAVANGCHQGVRGSQINTHRNAALMGVGGLSGLGDLQKRHGILVFYVSDPGALAKGR